MRVPEFQAGPQWGWCGGEGCRHPARPPERERDGGAEAGGGLGTPHSPSPPPHLPSAEEPGIRSFQSGPQQTCRVRGWSGLHRALEMCV